MKIGRFAKLAKDLVDKNGDKIAAGVNKATDLVDKKTKGKHSDKLTKIDDLANKLDKTRRPDTDDAPPTDPPPPPTPPGP